ncbi:hypothetical protein EJ02DRAFT_100612 [Clathrospora elynae]|uniref:2EXR domain-containing protein n=1 Tax=Clathrospora elynae TaxID=706981 RepID=A0A6A5SXI0_9PLEO|nr:hypothetical protein EJ02DRAFT_100612 [Clathrospora elynae]
MSSKYKSSKVRPQHIMAATFRPFLELPAELRGSIWAYALEDEKEAHPATQGKRTIILYNYEPSVGSISVKASGPYPTLFSVNREARYEAAKLASCDWVTVHARYCPSGEVSECSSFKLCTNFRKDTIYLPEIFLGLGQRASWTSETNTPEHYHLKTLGRLLETSAINKIEHLSVSIKPPAAGPRYLEHDAWWRGEGLEIFCLGDLQDVHLFSIKEDHVQWAKLIVEDYLQFHWVEDGWKTARPEVTVTERRRTYGSKRCDEDADSVLNIDILSRERPRVAVTGRRFRS